jgi:uncharacterized protein (TIGR01370 family)
VNARLPWPSRRWLVPAGSRIPVALVVLAVLASAETMACGGGGADGDRSEPAATATTPPSPSDDRLAQVETFALALGDPLDSSAAARLAPFDLVVVDGEGATTDLVQALRADGGLVLGYLSVGTVEDGRGWTAAADPYRLERWEDWDEDYADVADPGFRRLMVEQVAPGLLATGVDGLFLDNTDMVIDHPDQAEGMVELVAELASLVHGRGGLVFTQNGDTTVDALLDHLDGWNREDVTSTYSFEDETYEPVSAGDTAAAEATLRRLAEAGLLVTTTDYVADGDDDATGRAVEVACGAGALPFVADIDLTRMPPEPYRC